MKRSRQLRFRAGPWQRLSAASLVLALVLSLAAPAAAGAVHGRVTLNGTPVRDTEIVLTNDSRNVTIRVRTDGQGNYTAVLVPGIYTVTMGQHRAKVRSYLGRTRKDIDF